LNLGALPGLYLLLREEFAFGYTGIAVIDVSNQSIRGPVQFSFGLISRFVNRMCVLTVRATVTLVGMIGFAGSQNYLHLYIDRPGASRRGWGRGRGQRARAGLAEYKMVLRD